MGLHGKYDGVPVKVKGNLSWDKHAEKQIDATTVSQEDTKEGGNLHITRRVSVLTTEER
jgi:hypothetical protein